MKVPIPSLLQMIRMIATVLIFLVLCACDHVAVSTGFYHWTTTVDYSARDIKTLNAFGIERLYIRFFDVGYRAGKGVFPVAPADIRTLPGTNIAIVPVVFITQDAIMHCDPAAAAQGITARVLAMAKDAGCAERIAELQIDCDWTAGSRDVYFALLISIREGSGRALPGIPLSSTIRLHQVKYRTAMGIPPVDRGMLMVYNTGSPREFSAANAIYDRNTADRYLKYLPSYPLVLDVAVPVYSQGRQYDARSNFVRLFNGMRERDIAAAFDRIAPHVYRAKCDTYVKGARIMQGDLLAVDETGLDDALAITRRCVRGVSVAKRNIVLYHFDNTVSERFSDDTIRAFTNALHRL